MLKLYAGIMYNSGENRNISKMWFRQVSIFFLLFFGFHDTDIMFSQSFCRGT